MNIRKKTSDAAQEKSSTSYTMQSSKNESLI